MSFKQLGGVVVILHGFLGVNLDHNVPLATGQHVIAVNQESANVAAPVGGHYAHFTFNPVALHDGANLGLVFLIRGGGHQIVALG